MKLHRLAVAMLVLASAPGLSQIATTASERFQRLDVNHDGVLSRY